MNLWVSMEDEGARTSDERAFDKSLAPLAVHLAALGAPRPVFKPYSPARFEDQARVLLDAKVPVFSFICGVPPREILEECRTKGIVTIGTATTPDEAAVLQDAGVDVIVASGFEAGGHRGSFLRSAEDSLTGTSSLVPQIVDIVDVPVIAAGGIGDARGIVAALALGAEGVQLGTAFLACEESGASPLHREALLGKAAGHTALTRGFTGRLARGIHNRLMEELNRNGTEILPYPLQRGLVKNLSHPRGGGGPIRSCASLCRAKAPVFLRVPTYQPCATRWWRTFPKSLDPLFSGAQAKVGSIRSPEDRNASTGLCLLLLPAAKEYQAKHTRAAEQESGGFGSGRGGGTCCDLHLEGFSVVRRDNAVVIDEFAGDSDIAGVPLERPFDLPIYARAIRRTQPDPIAGISRQSK